VKKINRKHNGEFDDNFRNIPTPSGFNATNKSVGITIHNLIAQYTENNAIILITSSNDNASIIYDENDLIELAVNNNIPIYIIAVGSSVATYNLAKLANKTGGQLYYVDDEDINNVAENVSKIISAAENYYLLNINTNLPNDFSNVALNINISNGNRNISVNYDYIVGKEKFYSDYQTIASFQIKDTLLSNEFIPTIKIIAQVLANNSHIHIQLIGNANAIEGTNDECFRLGWKRAKLIKDKLVQFGARVEQIRISSEGSNCPIFQFPRTPWQYEYNNRVEFSWLIPENFPFEIISDYSASEEEAEKLVEMWGSNDCQAYYQRIMQNNLPAYRILLWGFQTEYAANKKVIDLKKKFRNKNFVIK
jgi:outer membrane protein OmpA-like peptidoglycan-associated protein